MKIIFMYAVATLIFIASVFAVMFFVYLFIGFIDWLVGDPLSILNNCNGCEK